MKVDQEINVFGKELRIQLYAKILVSSNHCAEFKERISVYPWRFCQSLHAFDIVIEFKHISFVADNLGG